MTTSPQRSAPKTYADAMESLALACTQEEVEVVTRLVDDPTCGLSPMSRNMLRGAIDVAAHDIASGTRRTITRTEVPHGRDARV